MVKHLHSAKRNVRASKAAPFGHGPRKGCGDVQLMCACAETRAHRCPAGPRTCQATTTTTTTVAIECKKICADEGVNPQFGCSGSCGLKCEGVGVSCTSSAGSCNSCVCKSLTVQPAGSAQENCNATHQRQRQRQRQLRRQHRRWLPLLPHAGYRNHDHHICGAGTAGDWGD